MADGLVVLFARSTFAWDRSASCRLLLLHDLLLLLDLVLQQQETLFLFKALLPSTKSMFHRVFDLHSVSQTARIMASLSILGYFQFSSCL